MTVAAQILPPPLPRGWGWGDLSPGPPPRDFQLKERSLIHLYRKSPGKKHQKLFGSAFELEVCAGLCGIIAVRIRYPLHNAVMSDFSGYKKKSAEKCNSESKIESRNEDKMFSKIEISCLAFLLLHFPKKQNLGRFMHNYAVHDCLTASLLSESVHTRKESCFFFLGPSF